MIDQHESFTYQLKPDNEKLGYLSFYKGNIYSARWISESVASKKLLKKEEYFLCINIDEKSKKLNIAKKKKYTIVEGIKFFEVIMSHKNSSISNPNFWSKL